MLLVNDPGTTAFRRRSTDIGITAQLKADDPASTDGAGCRRRIGRGNASVISNAGAASPRDRLIFDRASTAAAAGMGVRRSRCATSSPRMSIRCGNSASATAIYRPPSLCRSPTHSSTENAVVIEPSPARALSAAAVRAYTPTPQIIVSTNDGDCDDEPNTSRAGADTDRIHGRPISVGGRRCGEQA